MRFGVLGPLAVRDGDGEPVKVPETKVRALLADLLVHEGRPVSADRLIDDLWGGAPPGRPAGALQAKVSQLRRALGRDRVPHGPSGYRLRIDEAAGDEVDAFRFRTLVETARSEAEPRSRAELLTSALELWRGPAYADFADAEFVRAAAHRLAEQRLAVLEDQAEARLAAGDHTLLTGELADLAARHPLRERLRAVQMRALYLAGRQSEALDVYGGLRQRLASELGLTPGPELTALHGAILRQDPTLAASTPAATDSPPGAPAKPPSTSAVPPSLAVRPGAGASAATPTSGADVSADRGNLPVSFTGLVGRGRAVGEVGRMLGGARVVTLVGAGGVGKTRLAVEAAGRLAAGGPGSGSYDFRDGVWLVEFAGRRGDSVVADLAQAVAAVLGLRDDAPAGLPGPGTADEAEQLAAALRDRAVLLVLDNCEQVVEAAAELTDRLLRAAPGLRVLATSQEPLGLAGEAVFAVEPLLPADAVSLFAARAAAAAPGFALDGHEDAVAEICRRLDGIPLALELAATRVRSLGVAELAARLDDRFRLLDASRRGAPARQRTLRAMIDWSWELLGPSERVVLRRLAVHRDGCALEAAELVCSGGGVAPEDVASLVGRLVDRSLVVAAPGPTGLRYRLLESVAAYALERLREAGELDAVRGRHLEYYLGLAERAEPFLRDGGQRHRLGLLDAEAGNLREALDLAVRSAGRGADGAVRLVTALAWWWLLRGRLTEGRRALSAVLDLVPDSGELRLLRGAFALLTGEGDVRGSARDGSALDGSARFLWLYAYGLFSAGRVAAAEESNARALQVAEAGGERWVAGAAFGLRGMLALGRGDLGAAGRDSLRAARIFRELGDQWGELQTLAPLALLAEIKGDYDEASRRQEDGLRIARDLGLASEISARLSGLGRLALLTRDWQRARALHGEARDLAVEQGYRYGEIHAEMGLALGARRSGDLDAAESYLLRVRDRHTDVSSPAGDHLLRAELGFIAELRGDARLAEAHHLHGLDIARRLDEPRSLALSLEGLAGAAALGGDPADAERAALLLGAADAARRGVGAPLPPAERGDVDRITEAASTALRRAPAGAPSFAEAFARGATLSPRQLPYGPPAGLPG